MTLRLTLRQARALARRIVDVLALEGHAVPELDVLREISAGPVAPLCRHGHVYRFQRRNRTVRCATCWEAYRQRYDAAHPQVVLTVRERAKDRRAALYVPKPRLPRKLRAACRRGHVYPPGRVVPERCEICKRRAQRDYVERQRALGPSAVSDPRDR